jgi:DNA polymerase III subunit gamma/tau
MTHTCSHFARRDEKLPLSAAGSCEPGQALTGAALSIRFRVRKGVASRSLRDSQADCIKCSRPACLMGRIDDHEAIQSALSLTARFRFPLMTAAKSMDAQYTVLARRFRPQTFTEVVGQERIAQTLRNAIHEGRVAHAYLFTGARGVGKTSMARIFAKALNCPNAVDGVPCNQCEICLGIAAGQDVDVSEIDGASNRGIDDIRSLRANVGVKSMRSKYKVYIIDEVHMLTKEAFNALLKTLEEPPPLVKFIFCTTEPNKVPDTILSRCQRFDFGTISVDNISLRLSQLAEAEGFQVEPAAVELVARRAAGSMRDSQSLFDQLLAFGAERITAADVHRLLGTAPDDRVIGIVDSLIDRDRAKSLERLESALSEGVQLEALTDQLIGYFRDLLVTACSATEAPLLSVGTDQRPKLQEQSTRWGLQTIVAAMQLLAETKARMQRVTFGRALVELVLVRISLLEELDRLDEIVARLKGGGSLGAAPSAGAPRPVSAISQRPAPTPVASPETQKKTTVIGPTGEEAVRSREAGTPPAFSPPAQSFPTAPPSTALQPIIEWKRGCEKDLHAAILERLSDMTGTHLRRVASIAISGPNQLDLFFPANYDLDRRACDRPEIVGRIESLIEELVGQRVKIQFRIAEATTKPDTMVPQPIVPASSKSQFVELPEDPYMKDVMEVFGIKIWKVQPQAIEAVQEPGEAAGDALTEEE